MPGYLTNRYVSLIPALQSDVDDSIETLGLAQTNLEQSVSAINVRLTEAEGNIDDLSLNIGV